MAQGDKPVKEFRAGGVRASIWKDEIAGQGQLPLGQHLQALKTLLNLVDNVP